MKEVVLINKQSLNEFLNIKDIRGNLLYTLDNQIIMFLKVYPINIDLLSEKELENKMELMSIEFSNEHEPYNFYVMQKNIDISEYIQEQEILKQKLGDETSINIIRQRIAQANGIMEDKNIIENEVFLCIWGTAIEGAEDELNRRANNWIIRLKSCDFYCEKVNEEGIILLVKSFTIPEFARTEDFNYKENIMRIGGE